ncbi:MAG: DUF3775 domain-containing protein [Planctomycetia bacterium]|nr:DUF3775 domain-containing protein [Planctomycetia bacterium]
MRLSEATQRVIELARKISDYYTVELPKWHPQYPVVGQDEPTAPPPPEEVKLKDFLDSLPAEVVYQILAIMDLGREDIDAAELTGNYETLKEQYGDPQDAAALMLSNAALADQLTDGLAELQRRQISVDRLPSKKAGVRKR